MSAPTNCTDWSRDCVPFIRRAFVDCRRVDSSVGLVVASMQPVSSRAPFACHPSFLDYLLPSPQTVSVRATVSSEPTGEVKELVFMSSANGRSVDCARL